MHRFEPYEWLSTTVNTCAECGALADDETFAHRVWCSGVGPVEFELFETYLRSWDRVTCDEVLDELEGRS